MFSSVRLSMAWLHTWFGLVLGYVLMACFFFGTLSVFDREIDRWAIPETRFPAQPMPSFDVLLKPVFARLRPDPADMDATAERVVGPLPHPDKLHLDSVYAFTTHRDPVLGIGGEFGIPNAPIDPGDDHLHVHGFATIDPRDGTTLPDDQLKIGSEFFYPMHYSLHLHWKELGYWIVGLAALAMLAALVSGVVMHRRIVREMFTFRPEGQLRRGVLDLHNLTGVVALPFHFFFALTGLTIFGGIYLPLDETMLKPMAKQHEAIQAALTGLPHEPADVAAPLASVDAMVAEARRRWAARGMPGEVGYLFIDHLGDRNSYVSVFRAGSDQVASLGQGVHFEAATGRLIREDPAASSALAVNDYLTGLHLQQFRHWLLRWLYVLGGLSGCVCIATGFVFFIDKRKQRLAASSARGVRIVEALAVSAVTGMVIATLAILVANRVLPSDLPLRGTWEERVFWIVWLAALLHALWRTSPVPATGVAPAWREQCWLIACLAPMAVLANWASTGDHLFATLSRQYWPVAGVDMSLLCVCLVAVVAARTLTKRARAKRREHVDPEGDDHGAAVHG